MRPKLKLILVLVATLALLGVLAWGIGWGVHGLLARWAAPLPTATAEPMPSPAGSTPTAAPSPSPSSADDTPAPASTSTLAPTPPPTPEEEWITVRGDEGLYRVCRRNCPGRWSSEEVPPGLDEYARKVARTNSLGWPPTLYPDQELQMPPCPR